LSLPGSPQAMTVILLRGNLHCAARNPGRDKPCPYSALFNLSTSKTFKSLLSNVFSGLEIEISVG